MQKINKQYKFMSFEDKNIRRYKKHINSILINNVIHHLSDDQVSSTFNLLEIIVKVKF